MVNSEDINFNYELIIKDFNGCELKQKLTRSYYLRERVKQMINSQETETIIIKKIKKH